MDRTERFYKIEQLLRSRRVVPLQLFLQELQVSRATFKRDLEYLRERLNAPVLWDRERRGYVLAETQGATSSYALPGVWFNAAEIQALLSMQHLLANLQQGWLQQQLAPLQARLWAMLGEQGLGEARLQSRIRLLSPAARAVEPECFAAVSQAVLGRRCLHIDYFHRARNEVQPRTVSPQRLVHYRGNWYVDAWCHWRDDLRSFALDAIRAAHVLQEQAMDVDEQVLEERLASAYGIFSGSALRWAHLRFSAQRSRWVSAEQWHPQQRAELDEHGCLHLHIPYGDARELLMDILRHGPEVEVLAPDSLRQAMLTSAQALLGLYETPAATHGKETG